MKPMESLREQLLRLDGQDYGAYQSLKGGWDFARYRLYLDLIPKDPYAPASTGVYRVRAPRDLTIFPPKFTASPVAAVALRDYLARRFHAQCARYNKGRRGTGNSGILDIAEPGQSILERTALVMDEDNVEARFSMGLPATKRRINAKVAEAMLFDELPSIVGASLTAEGYAGEGIREEIAQHIRTAENAARVRDQLDSAGLVAFIADGALLPRASGVNPAPLDAPNVVRFKAPKSLRTGFDLPDGQRITGMGISKGVTLIVGGGYHGKSTLLQAVELGIYNHIPGDGREACVARSDTVKIRAMSGRGVTGTDISAFITGIPFGGDTTAFNSSNASGSTSQAAFIAESIEAGAKVLLMDEDTCATNFMIRDKRMQELVAKRHEPITAFVDKVRQLYTEHGISTVLVMGGSGDYFSAADCVIQMTEFTPEDVTNAAKEITRRFPSMRAGEGGPCFKLPRHRRPLADDLEPTNEYGHTRISALETRRLLFGRHHIDLHDVEQLVEAGQTKAIGRALLHARQYMRGDKTLCEIAALVMKDIEQSGLDVLDDRLTGDLAAFRPQEFMAALNRIRGLKINPDTP